MHTPIARYSSPADSSMRAYATAVWGPVEGRSRIESASRIVVPGALQSNTVSDKKARVRAYVNVSTNKNGF